MRCTNYIIRLYGDFNDRKLVIIFCLIIIHTYILYYTPSSNVLTSMLSPHGGED